jgi:hypothetical protein
MDRLLQAKKAKPTDTTSIVGNRLETQKIEQQRATRHISAIRFLLFQILPTALSEQH